MLKTHRDWQHKRVRGILLRATSQGVQGQGQLLQQLAKCGICRRVSAACGGPEPHWHTGSENMQRLLEMWARKKEMDGRAAYRSKARSEVGELSSGDSDVLFHLLLQYQLLLMLLQS
jgi:hypothetical protein